MTATIDEDELAPDETVEDGDEQWEAEPAELAAQVDHEVADLDPDREVMVSAFAGIGGVDLGFERAGFQTGVQIEWDAAASRVLAVRFPRAARYGDVRLVGGDAVRRSLGGRRVKVLGGGFPCQDLSVAGRRAGMAGGRSGLYGELLRLAQELDPDWLVVENVPGLLSADADPEANDGEGFGPGSGFALFLGDLTGYRPPVPDGGWRNSGVCHGPLGTCAWRVLDARHFGVAQRRRRVFVVFHPRDRLAPAAVLLEPEGVRRDPAARRPSWARAAAAAVGAAVRGRRGGPDRGGEGGAGAAVVETASTLQASGGERGYRIDAEAAAGGHLVPLATNALDGDVARALVAQGSADPHDYSQATYVVEGDSAGGIQQYPDGNVALEPHAPTLTRSQDAKVVDGRPRAMGHVEAHGGEDIAPCVTSKWHTGSGGPSGSETPNLVVVGNGDTEVAHAVTASGTDGMGRGVPAVAYPISHDALRGEGRAETPSADAEGDVRLRDPGLGVYEDGDPSPTVVAAGPPAVAYGVAIRGRDGGAVAELGEEEVANALRAGDGSSSRQPLVLPGAESVTGEVTHALTAEGHDASEDGTGRGTPIVPYVPEVAAPLTAGSHAPGVSAPGRRQEDDVNVVTFSEGKTGQAVSDLAPTIQSTQPGEASSRQTAVVTFRKARNAQTSEDDETWQETDYANTLNTFDGGDARAKEIVVEPTTWQVEPESGQGADLRARPADVSPALTATELSRSTDRGVRVATAAVRRLTPRECERLQGFPDDWTLVTGAKGKPATDSPRYKQLGNAVCVNVAEWIACRIAEYEAGGLR